MKPGGCALVFCRWDVMETFCRCMELAGFAVKSSIVWDRVGHGMGDLQGAFATTHDIILFGTKGRFVFPGKRPKDVIHCNRISGQKLHHPNEKPVELMKQLVEAVTVPDQIVCDPFMGSGSTGVACKKAGRSFWGCELDAGYYELSQRRILEEE